MTADTIGSSKSTNSQAVAANQSLHWLPVSLKILAAILLLVSMAFPYWRLVLEAPQYPQGLQMRVFVNRLTGDEDPTLDDVREIDGLNHYIGMKSLYTAARIERAIAIPAVIVMAILIVVSAFWRSRWAWVLTLPAITFPFIFLLDLFLWMRNYGQNLDPYAPLSSAIKPFTPPIIGEGVIGNFRTIAYVQLGWMIAVGGGVLIIVALVIQSVMTRRQANAQAT